MCSCDQEHPREIDEDRAEHQASLQRFAVAFARQKLEANAAREAKGPISVPIAGVQSPWEDLEGNYFANEDDAARHRQWQREKAERADKRRLAALAAKHAELSANAGNAATAAFLTQLAKTLESEVAA